MGVLVDNVLKNCTGASPLKKGGQKTVSLTQHSKFGKVVMKTGSFSSTTSYERIKREVNILKSINSHYFPKCYEFIVDNSDGSFIIIEEFIENQIFSDVKLNFNSEVKLVGLLKELMNALNILWEKSIVHRDLKPDNILFKTNFQPVIIDLGIARFLNMDSLTDSYASCGPCTPIYAAPEQLKNYKNMIDIRTDFFALGIIILELYLGFHPFQPDKVKKSNYITENILNNCYVKPESKEGTSSNFSVLINKLLKHQPYLRFRKHDEVIDFIDQNWR